MALSVVSLDGFIYAGSLVWFNDDEERRILREKSCVEANYSSCQCANSSLDDNVGRLLDSHAGKLLLALKKHGSVTLHDPCRNLCVSIPGSV